jgi:hypothetical protein
MQSTHFPIQNPNDNIQYSRGWNRYYQNYWKKLK